MFRNKTFVEGVGQTCCPAVDARLLTLAGEEGLEPSHVGIKIRCLNQLGDSPTKTVIITPILVGCYFESCSSVRLLRAFYYMTIYPCAAITLLFCVASLMVF